MEPFVRNFVRASLLWLGAGVLTPDEAFRRRRPVILVQAGIHAGEIEGKDAGRIIGKKGQTLEALQFLVNKIVNRDLDERREHEHHEGERPHRGPHAAFPFHAVPARGIAVTTSPPAAPA